MAVDVSGPDLQGATVVGALCWQPAQALNIVPFIEQGGNAAPFVTSSWIPTMTSMAQSPSTLVSC